MGIQYDQGGLIFEANARHLRAVGQKGPGGQRIRPDTTVNPTNASSHRNHQTMAVAKGPHVNSNAPMIPGGMGMTLHEPIAGPGVGSIHQLGGPGSSPMNVSGIGTRNTRPQGFVETEDLPGKMTRGKVQR